MKISRLALAIALAAMPAFGGQLIPTADETVRIDSELSVRRVAKDAFVVTHEPAFESNVLVVLMSDGTAVLCSSPFDTHATQVLLQWLRQAFAPKRILDINTHFHLDGAGGNEAYAEAGVETYASALTQKLLAERGEKVRDQAAVGLDTMFAARVKATKIVPADHTFEPSEGLTLTLGGETVRVIYPGPAHSPDNVVVLFPARDLLFGGCMIKSGQSIGYVGDADLGHWEAAVRSVEKLGAHIIIPGHGPVGGPELFQNTVDVVRASPKEGAK